MTEVDNLFSKLNLNEGGNNGDGGDDSGEWISTSKKNKKNMKNAGGSSEGHKKHFSDLRAGVILKKDNKYLLVRGQNTYDSEGKFGFPKGHVEEEDIGDFIKTAQREVREETGVDINRKAFNKDNVFREEKLILYIIDVNKNEDLIVIPKEFRKANEEIKKIGWFTIEQMRQTSETRVLDKMNSSLRKWLKSQK